MWYTPNVFFDSILIVAYVLAFIIVLVSTRRKAYYGKFSTGGIALNPKLGWFCMEFPGFCTFIFCYFQGLYWREPIQLVFLGIWMFHYGYMSMVFPSWIRNPKGAKANFGVPVLCGGITITVLNGYLNATFITNYAEHLTTQWWSDPRLYLGLGIYGVGITINIHADYIQTRLRTKEEVERGEKVYRIPHGGLYEYVTNPSYFGQSLAWLGFTIASWSLTGLFIFLLTIGNLVFRAKDIHQWYLNKFPEYPKHRKIMIPFLY